MIEIIEVRRQTEDSYQAIGYSIRLDGVEIGTAGVIDGEPIAYVERIDIDESQRNRGYGSKALQRLSDLYGEIIIAPDNEDAQRLYDRLGQEYHGDVADYLDEGFGVYRI